MMSPGIDARWGDALLGTALAAGAVAQFAANSSGDVVPVYAWVLATTVPLVWRRRAPVVIGLSIQLVFALGTPFYQGPQLLAQGISAFLVATYVAALGPRTWLGSAVAGVASVTILCVQGSLDTRYGTAGAVIANCVYVAMSWAVAAAVRLQVDRSDSSATLAEDALRASDERARQAVDTERARLARELHDVLGHSISVMVLRARGGVHEHRLNPELGLEALRDVEAVGTRALADVRLLLELDSDEDPSNQPDRSPQPGVRDITDLVERTRRGGLDVRLQTHGTMQAVSASLGLTAYRVTQESLTNVMRHSAARSALVVVTWGPAELVVDIDDDGPASPTPSGGHGLLGMRERVALLGGTLDAGGRPDGGFTVSARLPIMGPA